MNVNFNCGMIPPHYKYIRILPLIPWTWPYNWPKHVAGRYSIKSYSQNRSAFVGIFNKISCLKKLNTFTNTGLKPIFLTDQQIIFFCPTK